MNLKLTPVLVMYIVCGKRIEVRVRCYSDFGRAKEEASAWFSETDLLELATADGRATWDERDILAITGCEHWIGDTEGAALSVDILTDEITNPRRFKDAIVKGDVLSEIIASQQIAVEVVKP